MANYLIHRSSVPDLIEDFEYLKCRDLHNIDKHVKNKRNITLLSAGQQVHYSSM